MSNHLLALFMHYSYFVSILTLWKEVSGWGGFTCAMRADPLAQDELVFGVEGENGDANANRF